MPVDLSLGLALVALLVGAVPAFLAWRAKGSLARVGHKPLVAAALLAGLVIPPGAGMAAQMIKPEIGSLLNIGLYAGAFIAASLIVLLFNWLELDSGLEGGLGALGALGVIFVKGQDGPLAAQSVLSMALGLSAACLVWGALGYRQSSLRLGLPAGSLLLASGLIAFREADPPIAGPGVIALAAALGSLAVWALAGNEKLQANKGRVGLAVLIVIGATLGFAGLQIGSLSTVGVILATAAAITLVLDFSLAKGFKLSGVGGLLYLSAAAWSFSQLQGSGLALFAAAGALSSLVAGRSDLMPLVTPLVGFSLYRTVLEASEGATKAFDIGQHYGMIGLLAGAFLVLAVVQLLEGSLVDCKIPLVRGLCAALAFAAALIGAALLLGDKGVAGLILGAGIPSLFLAGRSIGQALTASLLAIAGGATLALSWKGLLPFVDLTRDAKQTALIVFGLTALVLGAAAVMLARSKQEARNG